MIKVLAYYFTTGNKAKVAWNRFEDVKMNKKNHTGKTFPEFKAHFQSSTIKGQVFESEWFSYILEQANAYNKKRLYDIKETVEGRLLSHSRRPYLLRCGA